MKFYPNELSTKESLLALYQSVQNDIAFYRNWEWSITVYYAVLSTGIIGLVTNSSIGKLMNCTIQIGLTVVQAIALFYSIYHLHKTHQYLAQNRQLRNKIENLLGFFQKDVYIKDDSILPQQFNNISRYYRFEFKEFIFPFLLFLVIYELVTIYIIWKI
jgi:hypothetical protein